MTANLQLANVLHTVNRNTYPVFTLCPLCHSRRDITSAKNVPGDHQRGSLLKGVSPQVFLEKHIDHSK
jgi:hypothetical protein